MSVQLIQQYHAAVGRKIRYGGSSKESAVRNEFYNLVQQYARPRKLEFVAEINYKLPGGSFVTPDGTLKDGFRQDWGYWEAKDRAKASTSTLTPPAKAIITSVGAMTANGWSIQLQLRPMAITISRYATKYCRRYHKVGY